MLALAGLATPAKLPPPDKCPSRSAGPPRALGPNPAGSAVSAPGPAKEPRAARHLPPRIPRVAPRAADDEMACLPRAEAPEFDLVVLGATGFTGSLVCEHIAAHYPGRFKWAVAGRDPARLREVASRAAGAGAPPPAEFLCDTADAAACELLASRTRVLLSAAGPFWRYGRNVAAACARAGTAYVDTTGEPAFVRWSLDELSGACAASGARLVPMCGEAPQSPLPGRAARPPPPPPPRRCPPAVAPRARPPPRPPAQGSTASPRTCWRCAWPWRPGRPG